MTGSGFVGIDESNLVPESHVSISNSQKIIGGNLFQEGSGKVVIKHKLIFIFLMLLSSVFYICLVTHADNNVIKTKQMIKSMSKKEDLYIKTMATNGKDIVVLVAISQGRLLIYNAQGDFEYILEFPGGGTIQHISFIDADTISMIYGKGNTPYKFNLNDLNLQLTEPSVTSKNSYPYSVNYVSLDSGNRFVKHWVFPLQSQVKMIDNQGNIKIIYKQNQKNTIIISSIIILIFLAGFYKKRKSKNFS